MTNCLIRAAVALTSRSVDCTPAGDLGKCCYHFPQKMWCQCAFDSRYIAILKDFWALHPGDHLGPTDMSLVPNSTAQIAHAPLTPGRSHIVTMLSIQLLGLFAKSASYLVKLLPEVIIDALQHLDKLTLEDLMHPKAGRLKESMQGCRCCAICRQAIQQPACTCRVCTHC